MKALRKTVIATTMVVLIAGITSYAQGPLQKRVNYSINVAHAMRMGNYILPAGDYVLYQLNMNNPNLFGLYERDLTNEPVAILQTVRIDYSVRGYPEKTKMLINVDEESYGRNSVPVLRGWTIPGDDGWEIVSVVEKKRGILVHVR
jgi:hypothetical protein